MPSSPDFSEITSTYLVPWGINIGLALLVFLVGRLVVTMLVGALRKLLGRTKLDPILVNFFATIVKTVLLLFVIIAALDQLGVNTTSIIALLGAAGLAVGLAMKDSLQNFASGVMLIVLRPFKAGDWVEVAGTAGSVERINIFSTELKTGDNKQVIIPNGAIYKGNIVNYSAKPTRRIDMVFGISYDDDIRKARDIISEIIGSEERVLALPEPVIAVGELADSSVNLFVRPWVNTPDYWAVKFHLTERIKIAFDENDITIPYPQMDVHMEKPASAA